MKSWICTRYILQQKRASLTLIRWAEYAQWHTHTCIVSHEHKLVTETKIRNNLWKYVSNISLFIGRERRNAFFSVCDLVSYCQNVNKAKWPEVKCKLRKVTRLCRQKMLHDKLIFLKRHETNAWVECRRKKDNIEMLFSLECSGIKHALKLCLIFYSLSSMSDTTTRWSLTRG